MTSIDYTRTGKNTLRAKKMNKLRDIRLKLKKETNCTPKLLEEISSYILSLEDEVNYYESIFDFSWPSAKEILKSALQKIKEEEESHKVYIETIARFSVWQSKTDSLIFAFVYEIQDDEVGFILINNIDCSDAIVFRGLVKEKLLNFRINFKDTHKTLWLK